MKLFFSQFLLLTSFNFLVNINILKAQELPIVTSANDLTESQIKPIINLENNWLSQNDHDHHNIPPVTEENNDDYLIEETPNSWDHPIHGEQIFWLIQADQLEYRINPDEDSFNWDIHSWVGGDYQKLWIKTEGNIGLEEGNGEAEIQVLYSKLIDPFWDLQTGIRYDQLSGNNNQGRAFAVIGVQGVAPYQVEINTDLFISHQGDISARFSAEKEFLLSQRLVLQPKFEINIAAQTVEDFGVGSGINDIELGLRLRYEVNRNFAPYLGINWHRKLFDTANLSEKEGENIDNLSLVGGVRLFF